MKMWKLGVLAFFVGACQMPDSGSTGNDSASVAGGDRGTTVFSTGDPSVFRWTRVYCTADSESHIATESVELGETNFAPPAPPLHVGGGGAATATFFGGFEPGWGARDAEQQVYHAAPAVQWLYG